MREINYEFCFFFSGFFRSSENHRPPLSFFLLFLTLPKGPESTSSTDWKSDLPEWRISLTSIDHFRSSWSSSSSCEFVFLKRGGGGGGRRSEEVSDDGLRGGGGSPSKSNAHRKKVDRNAPKNRPISTLGVARWILEALFYS